MCWRAGGPGWCGAQPVCTLGWRLAARQSPAPTHRLRLPPGRGGRGHGNQVGRQLSNVDAQEKMAGSVQPRGCRAEQGRRQSTASSGKQQGAPVHPLRWCQLVPAGARSPARRPARGSCPAHLQALTQRLRVAWVLRGHHAAVEQCGEDALPAEDLAGHNEAQADAPAIAGRGWLGLGSAWQPWRQQPLLPEGRQRKIAQELLCAGCGAAAARLGRWRLLRKGRASGRADAWQAGLGRTRLLGRQRLRRQRLGGCWRAALAAVPAAALAAMHASEHSLLQRGWGKGRRGVSSLQSVQHRPAAVAMHQQSCPPPQPGARHADPQRSFPPLSPA